MTTIRRAAPADSRAIARVHILARADAMPYLPDLHNETGTIGWIEQIVLPHQIVWVAEEGDRIVGVAALDGQVLEQLYVLTDAQGRGIGSELLQVAMNHAAGSVELWTFQRNTNAREFYERRGFAAVTFTDGADNEEQEPDVLYRFQTERPLLFVDIDGVLNMYGGPCPPGYREIELFPQDDDPVRINPDHSAWLAELATAFDLVWASGWGAEDRDLLPTVLTLPVFAGAVAMPPIPFDPAEKVPAVARYAGSRACAWIDDLLTPAARDWAENREAVTLLIHTDPAIGMTRLHVDQLLAWAVR